VSIPPRFAAAFALLLLGCAPFKARSTPNAAPLSPPAPVPVAVPDDPCAYFPPPSTEPTFACWFGRCLKTMNEPAASALEQDAPFVRFLWVRSFHRAIAVRVTRTADGGRLEAKRLHGPECESELEDRTRDLEIPSEAVVGLFASFDRAHFWGEDPPASNPPGADGAQWVFEGYNGESYRMLHYWSADLDPQKTTPAHMELRNAALELLELAAMTPKDPAEIY
jgi:hypothetical protein